MKKENLRRVVLTFSPHWEVLEVNKNYNSTVPSLRWNSFLLWPNWEPSRIRS